MFVKHVKLNSTKIGYWTLASNENVLSVHIMKINKDGIQLNDLQKVVIS